MLCLVYQVFQQCIWYYTVGWENDKQFRLIQVPMTVVFSSRYITLPNIEIPNSSFIKL